MGPRYFICVIQGQGKVSKTLIMFESKLLFPHILTGLQVHSVRVTKPKIPEAIRKNYELVRGAC